MYTIVILVLTVTTLSVKWSETAKVNLTADRLLLLELENKYLNVFQSSNCPMRRSTKSEKDIMDSLDRCRDSDELLDKMITKVQDALERVVAFIKIHGSSTTLSKMQLRRLQKYRNQLHGDNFISVFTCPICSIKSITFIGLWKHMSELHNIYLRAKGMLSTIIARDAFITPRKLILKRKFAPTDLSEVNGTTDPMATTEKPRRVLKKIRRRKKVAITVTTVPSPGLSLQENEYGDTDMFYSYQDPQERRNWNSFNETRDTKEDSDNVKARKRLNRRF